jgi:4-hydroxyphenylpyruvate dioxygenase
MIPAIATVCLSGSLPEKLRAIADAGFSDVEIFENDLIAYHGSPSDVRKLCADLGLNIITVQPFRDFEGYDEPRRGKTFDRAERKFDLLQTLGADLLFVCSSVSPEAHGGIERLAADFHELGERAAKRGLRAGFEALAWGRFVNDYRDAWEIVRRAAHPSVGLILDSFHILSRGTELDSIATIPADRVFFVQIADAPKLNLDYLSWSRHWRCMPGQGELNLSAFIDALAAMNYRGATSLEIFNDRFRAGSARSVAIDGHRSLIALIDDASKRAKRPLGRINALPERPTVESVEFIEFAVDETERHNFIDLLHGLGFQLTGKHRSKDVILFSQGDIRIVVNSDKEGFAHSYNMSHGTSVCAMALRVSDALTTVARGEALLEEPYAGAIGPGELSLPAVRGLGGSLIYFVDDKSELSRWSEVDFEPVVEETKSAGLLSIDHISQTMQYEEMLTWLLYYTTLLKTAKLPAQAVMDPGGVVQSQVIEAGVTDNRGGLRLVLNGSQSHRTLSSRFVTEFFGSGVQNIAFETADIIATMETLARNGVAILAIPENYYDDLNAKLEFDDTTLAKLKRLNIMFDRDTNGIFFQAYTQTLPGGLFFEIVQRSDYKDYGAPNAAIRLVAQARLVGPDTLPRR